MSFASLADQNAPAFFLRPRTRRSARVRPRPRRPPRSASTCACGSSCSRSALASAVSSTHRRSRGSLLARSTLRLVRPRSRCRGPAPCMHLACCACSACSASVSPAAPHLRRFRVTEAPRRGSAGCHPSCHPSANRRRLKRLSAPWNRHFFGDRNARAKSQTGATSCGSAD